MAGAGMQSVASELLVNDRTLVLPAPPVSLTTSGDLVWIALSDGKVEVRNARTGEAVRRFEPALATTNGDAISSAGGAAPVNGATNAASAAGILSTLTNRLPAGSPIASGAGLGAGAGPSILKKRKEDVPARAAKVVVVVRSLLAVPVADGSTHVWLGLSNGSIEVHEGGDLLHSAVGVLSASGSDSFRAVLRRHTAAVTCLAEFGGYVYSGSEDQSIAQWRASKTCFVTLFTSQSPHTGAVRCLYAEGNAIVSGSDDGTVKVWDAGEGVMRLTGYFHSRSGGVLSLCRVGELMWSGDASGQVVRWHIRTCEAVGIHAPHRDRVLSLCHVGDRVYSGSADGTMGIFDAAGGHPLQQITDQALGWVTTVTCPAELSRFVVWSASADGAVRCWYQDEFVSMSADEFRFNDPSWYESGSTPYREFRAAVGQRTNRRKRELEAVEQRDQQTMALLRRCSTVFGGGSGADFEEQMQRQQAQLAKAEDRSAIAEARRKQKQDGMAEVDRDIATTLALLQSTKNELNQLLPGEAERLLATMPSTNAADLVPYGQAVAPSVTADPPPPAPSSTYATGTAVPAGPPSALPALPPPPPTSAALPPAATPSTLGVGGPLSTTPPPPPVTTAPTALPPPQGSSEATTANTTAAAAAAPPLPPPTGVAPSPAPPLPSTAPTTAAAGATATTATAAAAPAAVEEAVSWTNPHVGNYIQRRYYGASPSLRTVDLMREERRRGRLPRVKVEPLQRGRTPSATSAAALRSQSSSGAEKKKSATTTTTTMVRTNTTTTTIQASS